MKIYVDIDETICFYNGERNYPDAVPNMDNIAKINKLYDEGHEITYWTARGTVIDFLVKISSYIMANLFSGIALSLY